jgi:hypothetical protein
VGSLGWPSGSFKNRRCGLLVAGANVSVLTHFQWTLRKIDPTPVHRQSGWQKFNQDPRFGGQVLIWRIQRIDPELCRGIIGQSNFQSPSGDIGSDQERGQFRNAVAANAAALRTSPLLQQRTDLIVKFTVLPSLVSCQRWSVVVCP